MRNESEKEVRESPIPHGDTANGGTQESRSETCLRSLSQAEPGPSDR